MTGRRIAKHTQMTKWVDDVKAAHTSRTNDGDFGGTPTQLNFNQ